jgi:hypothetical protein
MCICDRESRSLEPSSSVILHWERANKVFEKRSLQLISHFVKFFTTARLPLHRSRAEGHRLQRELRQADRHLHPIVIVKEPQIMYSFYSQIMSYIFNMLICLGMILLDNLIQYLLFIAIIDLSKTCRTASTLIYDVLVMFMIYPWIKIKLKVLIFSTILLQPSVFEIAILQEGLHKHLAIHLFPSVFSIIAFLARNISDAVPVRV